MLAVEELASRNSGKYDLTLAFTLSLLRSKIVHMTRQIKSSACKLDLHLSRINSLGILYDPCGALAVVYSLLHFLRPHCTLAPT